MSGRISFPGYDEMPADAKIAFLKALMGCDPKFGSEGELLSLLEIHYSMGWENANPFPDYPSGTVMRHFKGNFYQIDAISEHTETGEWLVIYHSLKEPGKIWARPAAMFFSPVDREKYPNADQSMRFEKAKPGAFPESGERPRRSGARAKP